MRPLVENDLTVAGNESSARAGRLIMDRNRSQTSSGEALAVLRSRLDLQR
jgi:hypothetical protein